MRDFNQILIVDDNKIDCFINQKICSITLDSISIKTFNCGVTVLDYFKETSEGYKILPKNNSSIDIILLDINMPGMNGFEVLKELEKSNFFSHKQVEVYFLSSSNNEDDISEALNMESCSGYIVKPLTKEKLIDAIKTSKKYKEVFL